jgi:tryptophanyl-tRNA synthetase
MSIAVTGIKPTGLPHLGNYLGMIKPALDLARDHEALYCIADYHALTAVRDGARLRALTYELAATLLALGLDATRTALYRQSDMPQVCEMAWILSCVTPKGLLNRAHAYKAAVDANRQQGREGDVGVRAGLYNYPILNGGRHLVPGRAGGAGRPRPDTTCRGRRRHGRCVQRGLRADLDGAARADRRTRDDHPEPGWSQDE